MKPLAARFSRVAIEEHARASLRGLLSYYFTNGIAVAIGYLLISATVGLLLGSFAGAAAAVITLGLAQCLAAPASMICILTLASAQKLGREKTASVYRGLERMGQVAGPVVFGLAISVMTSASALLLMGGVICALSLVFHLLWRLGKAKS